MNRNFYKTKPLEPEGALPEYITRLVCLVSLFLILTLSLPILIWLLQTIIMPEKSELWASGALYFNMVFFPIEIGCFVSGAKIIWKYNLPLPMMKILLYSASWPVRFFYEVFGFDCCEQSESFFVFFNSEDMDKDYNRQD